VSKRLGSAYRASSVEHWLLGRQGNIPFEFSRKHSGGNLREREFVDDVSRSLREGRFLVLLAGDGIREGVQSLTELVNRNATKAFSFALIEVALYQFGKIDLRCSHAYSRRLKSSGVK
jgi:hypothetical protein